MSSTQMRDEQSTPIPSAAMVDLKLEGTLSAYRRRVGHAT